MVKLWNNARGKFALLILIGASVVFLIAWFAKPNFSFHVTSYFLIKDGMTREQVREVIGVRPGVYGAPDVPAEYLRKNGNSIDRWINDDCVILVEFDAKGIVSGRSVAFDNSDRNSFLAPAYRLIRLSTCPTVP
jgi:hypothetical protein